MGLKMGSDKVETILYSRAKDGFKTILVEKSPEGRIFRVKEDARDYPSARQLLIGLTGSERWTFDRYFKQGKFRPRDLRVAELPGNRASFIISEMPQLFSFPGGEELTVDRGIPLPAVVMTSNSLVVAHVTLGIDLAKRGHEVAKLFYAGFAGKLMGAGIDPEEVLQEVYRGILVRNKGACPWDPRKSSFGHYVHMVCSCIISNYFRHENRKNAMEQTGIPGRVSDGDRVMVDVASDEALIPHPEGTQDNEVMVLHDLLKYVQAHGSSEVRAHPEILILMRDGYNRLEAAKKSGLSVPQVSRLFSAMQELVLRWADDR